MTTYAYMRVSTLEQAEGTSLDSQKRECKGLAMTHGVYIERYIEDGGVSGLVPFIERLDAHGAKLVAGDVVIVAKFDRFSRNALDALNTIQHFKKIGAKLIINGHGDVTDPTNIQAKAMLTIMAAFTELERETIRQRQREGQGAKKSQGGHIGGSAPFGYVVVGRGKDARLEVDPVQQKALGDAVTLRHEGFSLRHIAGALLETHGVKVSHESLRKALQRGLV